MNDIKELATAFAKSQQEIEGAIADKTNPAFRSKYADLGNVIDAIKPALRDHGLSFTQICHDADNAAKVETLILHASGQSLSCGVVSVPVSKHDAQGYGSALTYARRYSLAAAFGVAPEDDDGNAAAKATPKKDAKEPDKLKEEKPKSADTPPPDTTDKDKEYLQRGVAALTELFGTPEKRERIPEFIEARTTFKGNDGKQVPGVKQLKVLKGKRLEIFVHGVEKTLDDVKNTRVCPDCFEKSCKCQGPF